MYGDDFYIFEPPVKSDHENYHLEILLKHNRIFGPWPASYSDLCDDARLAILTYTMKASPAETLKTFSRIRESELCKENKEFVFKIMKLDPRDRPTAHQLLQDAWFEDVGVDEDVQLLEDVQESQLLNLA
jgi:serine/threonine protein kinase